MRLVKASITVTLCEYNFTLNSLQLQIAFYNLIYTPVTNYMLKSS